MPTLLPVGIDFLRKYYASSRFRNNAVVWAGFIYFDTVLAIIFAAGSTLVGYGFAVQFTHPEPH